MIINGTDREIKPFADLHSANLHGAYLSGANLSGADLHGANLSGANLSGADLHGAYLSGANLSGADLHGAYLYGAYLYGADLHGANLSGANLHGANLSGANLYGANLYGANLCCANLYGADLRCADMHYVNLRYANLRGADLSGAENVPKTAITLTTIVPETGAFEGWKKCKYDVIVRLQIMATAKRSNATGRKCRASKVKVLQVIGAREGRSMTHGDQVYRKGMIITVKDFDDNRWNECAPGIHFFITRAEAEAWT